MKELSQLATKVTSAVEPFEERIDGDLFASMFE
jgi:hypothetical protein